MLPFVLTYLPGSLVSKQHISAWLVKLISFVYEQAGLPIPQGIKDHQTRKLATSWADLAGVDPQQICDAATWSSTCTFSRHYRLDLATVSTQFWQSGSFGPGVDSSSWTLVFFHTPVPEAPAIRPYGLVGCLPPHLPPGFTDCRYGHWF